MKNYPDKIKAIIDLQQRGYELDFIMKGEFYSVRNKTG